jgi:hypothetical protein
MNKIGPFIVRVFNSSKAVVIFALAIPSALGVLLALSDWLNATSPYAVWIRANFILMCLAFAAIILAWTIYLVYDMRIRYIEGYKIKISGDLNATWESKGSLPLRISSDNELIITDCSEGCITIEHLQTALDQQLHHRRCDRIAVLLDLLALVAQHHILSREGHRGADLVRLQHPKAAILDRWRLAWLGQIMHRAPGHGRQRFVHSADRCLLATEARVIAHEKWRHN